MNIGVVKRQSFLVLFWQLALTLIGYFKIMYFSHTVGADILGAYFLYTSYFTIIMTFSDGGLGNATSKKISEGEDQNKYFTAYFVLRFLFVGSSILFLILFRSFFYNLNESGLFVFLLIFLFVSIFQGAISVGIAACGKVGIYSTCNSIGAICTVLLQFLGVILGYGAVGLALGTIGGLLIGAIIEVFFLKLRFSRFSWQHVKSLSSIAFWIFLTSSVSLLFALDAIFIGHFLNNTAVAQYKVIIQLSAVGLFVSGALSSALWPRINRWGKIKEIESIEKSLSEALSYSLLFVIPLFFGGVILGDKILYFFYGKEFIFGYSAFVVFLFLQIINVFQLFFVVYLDALYFFKESFRATLISAILNIVLNIILIPSFGIFGAAIALLCSVCISTFFTWRGLSRVIKVKIQYGSIFNILKSSMVMSFFIFCFRFFMPIQNSLTVLFVVIIGCLVFGFFIVTFDKKIWNDLQNIFKSMNKIEAPVD